MFVLIAALVGLGATAYSTEAARKAGSKGLEFVKQQQYAAANTHRTELLLAALAIAGAATTFAVVRLVQHGK